MQKFKREQSKKRGEEKEENDTIPVAFDVDIIIIYDDDFMNLTYYDCIWIADSSTSFDVISQYNFFTSYAVLW